MVFINKEGKFNDNSFLLDGFLFGAPNSLALYVIENNGTRMLIDTSTPDQVKRIINKLKEYDIYPIHKILLSHAHWDHTAAVNELKALVNDVGIEVLASENAIDNLRKPAAINEPFEATTEPIEEVTLLKEGDIIDLNGLKLEVINFFGHTMDSIALLDAKNRNIFTGDAVGNKSGYTYIQPAFMPPEFDESELLKTFQKLRDMKDKLNSIALAHFGVWTEGDFEIFLNEMEDFHFKSKNSIIRWYNEKLSSREISLKYFETYIPNSKIIEYGLLDGLEMNIKWLIEGLKRSGFI
ncbi:MAG TPA: MBL fold metallo-hydrolase [bacterium]|nr:MBL fold metallo-hydrolase [bacterium]